MRPDRFPLWLVALLFVAATPAAAQGGTGPFVDCAVFPCVHAPDGAEEIEVKTGAFLWVGSSKDEHVLAAALIWPAANVGDFQPVVDGVLFVAPIKGGGALYESFFIPPELVGALISVKAYATDGATVDEGRVVTCRFVTS